jgi:hypothetical protein
LKSGINSKRNEEHRIRNGGSRCGSDLLLLPHSVFLILYSSSLLLALMKDGICPKCDARAVHLMNGPYADLVHVPISTWSNASTDYYICVECGYLEIYVRDRSDLPKIARRWPRVGGE